MDDRIGEDRCREGRSELAVARMAREVDRTRLEVGAREGPPIDDLIEQDEIETERPRERDEVRHLREVVLLDDEAQPDPLEGTVAPELGDEAEVLEQRLPAAAAVPRIGLRARGVDR